MWDKNDYNFMEFVLAQCLKEIAYKEEYATLPPGALIKHCRGNREVFYHQLYENGRCKQYYLNPINDCELLRKLKRKKELTAIKGQMTSRSNFLRSLAPTVRRILSFYEFTPTMHCCRPSEKPEYQEDLQYLTSGGELVRSKSEHAIAEELFRLGLEYSYEKQLVRYGEFFYPDFTVVNPLSGEITYVEHLGMDTPAYIKKWLAKHERYNRVGLFEGQGLLITRESQYTRLAEIVRDAFTLQRYRLVVHRLGLDEKLLLK